MKKENFIFVLLLFAAYTSSYAINDTLKTINYEEIVVTATKFQSKLQESSKIMTILNEKQIQQSIGKDIFQLLNEQLGITVSGANANPAKDKSIYLRGASNQYTLLLLDGIPIYDPSGVGGAFDLRLIPISQISRIEILYGSQSTLYGSDAIAGVINIISKKEGENPFNASANLTLGSYQSQKTNLAINGKRKAITYQLGYTRNSSNGLSEAEDVSGKLNYDKDGFKHNQIQLDLGVRPGNKLSIHPFFRYSTYQGTYDAGAFQDDTIANYQSMLMNIGVSGKYIASKFEVHYNINRTQTNRIFEDAFGKYLYKGYNEMADLYSIYRINNQWQILTGYNYQRHQMIDENTNIKNPSFQTNSLFTTIFYKRSKFFGEIGGRLNQHSVFGRNAVFSINPAYFIKKNIKVFTNYSTGFKAPTLNELYGQFGANSQLLPQESENLDLGVQLNNAKNNSQTNANLFSRKIDQIIIYGPKGYINLNKQKDRGFEVSQRFQPDSKTTLKVYYTYVTGKVFTVQNQRDTNYFNLLRTPKHTIGLNINRQFNSQFFVSLNLKTFGTRNDLFFDLNTYETSSVILKPYTLIDLYADYSFKGSKFKLFIDAKNLLNQSYTEIYGYSTMKFNFNLGLCLNY